MSFGPRFIAVDWGTTNRRVYMIDDGAVVDTARDDRGVRSIAPDGYEPEIAGIRAHFGDLPMLLAGMVGSNIGWRAAPYVATPTGLRDLAANLLRVDRRTVIVPGLSTIDHGRGDVMRGEEVQLLGAVEAGLVPGDALLCQPGTHCKWVEMTGGEIARFTTAMTGELFALLRAHGTLAPQLTGDVLPGDAFLAGVRDGARRDLAASLFGIRAGGLLGLRADADAASYASGLLIGGDVAARLGGDPARTVHILADPVLGGLYVAAVEANGGTAHLVDSHAAFGAGAAALGKIIR